MPVRRFTLLVTVPLVVTATLFAATPQPAPVPRVPLETLPRVTLTVLSENAVSPETAFTLDHPVLAEWGLAVLVEAGGKRVLFDTGAGSVMEANAKALGVDLSRLDAIVLSHGHGDHTGGLPRALALAGKVELILHPAALETVYFKNGSTAVPLPPPLSRQELAARTGAIVETTAPTAVPGGMLVTGSIPRLTSFEDTGISGMAFDDAALTKPNTVPEDQAMFFRTSQGVVVLVGCAHAGIVNTLRYVASLTGERRIYAVIGGTHLLGASAERLLKTEEALRQYDVQKIMLMHCTGLSSFAEIARAIPGRASWPGVGARIEFAGAR